MIEYRSAFQLEAMIAEMAGFDPRNVQVTRVGHSGDFHADFVGKVAAVDTSRARHDIDAACTELRIRFRLRE